MVTLIRFVSRVLLIAHGLVHLLYLTRDVEEFTLDESWVVPADVRWARRRGAAVRVHARRRWRPPTSR